MAKIFVHTYLDGSQLSSELTSLLLRGVGIAVQEGVKQGVKEAVETMTTPSKTTPSKKSPSKRSASHQNSQPMPHDGSSESSDDDFISARKPTGEKTDEEKSFHVSVSGLCMTRS